MKKTIVVILIALISVFSAFSSGAEEKNKDASGVVISDKTVDSSRITEIYTGSTVLATVKWNSSETTDNITRSMVNETLEQYKEQGTELSAEEALDALVFQSLLSQFVKNLASTYTEEQINTVVAQAIVEDAAQYGMTIRTEEEAENFLDTFYHMNVNDYASALLTTLILRSYIEENYYDYFKDIPEPSTIDIRNVYQDSIDSFKAEASARIAHIFSAFGENETENKNIKNNLKNIKKQVDSGKISFEEAVVNNSDDAASKSNGGIISGWLTNGSDIGKAQLGDKAMKEIFKLKIGQLSDVVDGVQGYHIFKMVDYRPAKTLTLDDYIDLNNEITVRDYIAATIKSSLYTSAFNQAYVQLLNDLKNDAEINYYNN